MKFLANETSLLGDFFIKQTIEKSAVVNDVDDRVLIDFESLIQVLLKFEYICSQEDRNELRVWLYNNSLFCPTTSQPKFFDKNTLFVDVESLLKALKKEIAKMGLSGGDTKVPV